MAKEDVVAAQYQAIQDGEAELVKGALGACYDQGVADQAAAGGSGAGFSQADIDAAVAKAVSDAQAVDAQALSDAQASAAASLAAVQQSLVDMTAKEQLEEQAVAQFQGSLASLQGALDQFKALIPQVPSA